MTGLWENITDMRIQDEDFVAEKLRKDPEYQAAQKNAEELLKKVKDRELSKKISDAYTDEETIYLGEMYLAGMKRGFKMSMLMQSNKTLQELANEEKEQEERNTLHRIK